jgi:pimeloyl-ACP methyl ester carboxylesterase
VKYDAPLSALVMWVLVIALACGETKTKDRGDAVDSGAPDAAMEIGEDAFNPTADTGDVGVDASADAKADADASQPPSLTTIEVGPFTFDARIAGPEAGEPVFLLHGFPQTSYEWRAQIEALSAAGYRVIAPNQRGYSTQARPTAVEEYELPLLVADVLGMADVLEIDRFHLVGHDWGAVVAWALAATAPTRLLSVTPISVPHLDAFSKVLGAPMSCQYEASSYFDLLLGSGAEMVLLANNGGVLRTFYDGLPDDVVDHYVDFFLMEGALTGGINWYRANIEDRQTTGPSIGLISVPTMYIWSDGDTALCRDGAEITGDFVEGPYRFEVIEGVNHWVPEIAAEQVNTLLIDHLGNNAAN